MKVCTHCGERYTGEEITELRHEGEEFCFHPFMCPDCFDQFRRMDLGGQFQEAMNATSNDTA